MFSHIQVSFHEPVMETGYTSSTDPVEYETTRSDEGERQKEEDEGKTSDSDDQKSEGSGNMSPQSSGSPENSLNRYSVSTYIDTYSVCSNYNMYGLYLVTTLYITILYAYIYIVNTF